jgi:hypothetical protein
VFFDAAGKDHYVVGAFGLGGARDGEIGLCLEADGDDEFSLTGAPALGASIEGGLAWAEDRAGDDRYTIPGAGAGFAAGGGLGVFWDRRGRDTYVFGGTARAASVGEHRGAVALGLFADFGGGEDIYELTGTTRAVGNTRTERTSTKGAQGDVVSVFADR